MAVLLPAGPDGPRRLAAAGAARVLVIGSECPPEPGVEVWPGPLQPGHLPLRDASVDAVTCLDSFAGLTADSRRSLVGEARRVLRNGGVLAVGAPGEADALWQVEDELRTAFPHVAAFAQLAWQGVSLAPVLATAPDGALGAALREGLLREPLAAQRYVLLASSQELDEPLRECVIVPTGPADGVVRVGPEDEVIRAASTEDAGGYAFPTAADAANELPPPPRAAAPVTPVPEVDVADLDDLFDAPAPAPPAPVAPPAAPAIAPRLSLTLDPATQAQLELLRAQVAELSREREGLVNHAAKMANELERSREEKARAEAELYASRLRVEALSRIPEDSRLLPVGVLALHPDMQPESESPAHELADDIGLSPPEKGRATADAALDRNRLREELARRTAELQELETRVLQQEEELRREHLENVRLVTDVDRLREQVERSRAIEQERVQELERLGHELRKLEMAHAELQGLFNTQEQRLRDLEDAGMGVNTVDNSADAMALRELLHQAIGERDQARARERAGGELVRRRDRELADAQRTLRDLRRAVEEHASVAANLRGELAVLQVQVERLEETVPTLQDRLREQQRKTLDRDEEAAELQRRLEEAVAEQEHLRGRLRRHKQEMDALASAKQGAEVELFRLRRELEAKHQAIEQLQQIVALGTGRNSQLGEGGVMSEAGIAEAMRLRAMMADQAAEHAEALARSESEHQRINEVERARLRRARLESTIRAEEMEYLLFQLDTAEQRIWEMNDAADRAAARLAAGLAQLEKQKEQHEDLVDELEVTRNLLVEAQARVAELERLLDSERARLARLSLAPADAAAAAAAAAADAAEGFDVTVDEDATETLEVDTDAGDSMRAPVIQRDPDEPDPLAGIDFDDDSPQESLAARLAGSRLEESGEVDLSSALASAEVSSPSFSLPSDHDVDLDDDDDLTDLSNLPTRPRAYAATAPEEEDEEVFAIDTEGWIDDEDLGGPPQRQHERQTYEGRHEGRIVIEVLDDEAWPDDAGDGGAKLPS